MNESVSNAVHIATMRIQNDLGKSVYAVNDWCVCVLFLCWISGESRCLKARGFD